MSAENTPDPSMHPDGSPAEKSADEAGAPSEESIGESAPNALLDESESTVVLEEVSVMMTLPPAPPPRPRAPTPPPPRPAAPAPAPVEAAAHMPSDEAVPIPAAWTESAPVPKIDPS